MKFKLGDIITNRMKPGPHFIIMQIEDNGIVKALTIDGPNDGEIYYFSIEDMWVFNKV